MKLVVVVQARASSTRLPGKVLLPVAGAPLLVRMLERLQGCKTPFELVVATTTEPIDDPIVDVAREADVACVRGHPTDLLERHLVAGRELGAEAIAKIPSDCPLIDPRVVDHVLQTFLQANGELDYVSNLHPATWPDGYDVEVMKMDVLEQAGREATKDYQREHCTPFIWDPPGRFRTENVTWDRDLSMTHRLTIDYEADYQLIQAVYDALYDPSKPPFSLQDILHYLDAHPEVFALNAEYAGVNWYRHHLDELSSIDASRTRWTEDEAAKKAAQP